MKVITRMQTISRDKIPKAIKHDLRLARIPHADSSKPINVIFKTTYAIEIKGKKYAPLIKDYEGLIDAIFGYWNYINYLRLKQGKKAFRRNTRPVVEFIIAFDREARDFVNNPENWEKLDERARKYIKLLEEKFGILPIIGVRHSDETTTHYHILFLNYSTKYKKTFTKLFKNRREFSQLQDLVAEVFSDLGFKRGEKYDPSKHTHKAIHKSVRELHKELPKEIEQKRKELAELDKIIAEKLKTLEQLKEKEAVLININKEIERLKPTLSAYRSKKKKLEEELQELLRKKEEEERELKQLKEQKEKLQQELVRLQEILKELEERNKKLQAEETELNKKLEQVKQKLKELEDFKKTFSSAETEKEKFANYIDSLLETVKKPFLIEEGILKKSKVVKIPDKEFNDVKKVIKDKLINQVEKTFVLAEIGKLNKEELEKAKNKELEKLRKIFNTAVEQEVKGIKYDLEKEYETKIQQLKEKIEELKEEMQIYKEIAEVFKVNTPYEAEIQKEHYDKLEKQIEELNEEIEKLKREKTDLENKIWTIRQLLNQIGFDVYEQNGKIVITRYEPPSHGQGFKFKP
jgi:chromosome segregation ATPase